jgi:hypothetical protein
MARAEAVKGWFFREYLIAPSADGNYLGIRRGEITAAAHPCGYHSQHNR